MNVPGLGITTLISVHLSSSPKTVSDRAKQLQVASDWETSLPARDVIIYGGDFNTSFSGFPITLGYGVTPDYIFVEGAWIVNTQQVLTGQKVIDHAGGVLVEVER